MVDHTSRIEPAKLEELPESIADTIAELSAASAILGSALHSTTAANLASLVRVMNTYYSNLIEGHNTRPRDIERALIGDFDNDDEKRNLQIEASSHVRVQAEIDRMAAANALPEPASQDFIQWIHSEFYRDAPRELLRIKGAHAEFIMEPGELRSIGMQDVAVGRHIPPSSDRIKEFMKYFESRYQFSNMGKAARISAIASAHHRFNYIHPFPDGNGRVSRLMSHAMALKAGIGAHGLWSVSRGLARGLESRSEYKRMLDHADMPRQGDLDGRGNLSHRGLIEFTDWFLKVCLDQVNFMSSLFDLENLERRLGIYVSRSETLKPEAYKLLQEALIRGQFDRGDAMHITGLPERSARRVLNDLISDGMLSSASPKTPVSLRFPSDNLEVLFPKLYPET